MVKVPRLTMIIGGMSAAIEADDDAAPTEHGKVSASLAEADAIPANNAVGEVVESIQTSVFIAGAENSDPDDGCISAIGTSRGDFITADLDGMVHALEQTLNDPKAPFHSRNIARGALGALKGVRKRQSDPEQKSAVAVTENYVIAAVKLLEETGINVGALYTFIMDSDELQLDPLKRRELFMFMLREFCKKQVDRKTRLDSPLDELEIFLFFREDPLISPPARAEIIQLIVDNDTNSQLLARFVVIISEIGEPCTKVADAYRQLIHGEIPWPESGFGSNEVCDDTGSPDVPKAPISNPYRYLDKRSLEERHKRKK